MRVPFELFAEPSLWGLGEPMVVPKATSGTLALSRELKIPDRVEFLVERQGREGTLSQEETLPAHLLPLQNTGRGVGGPSRDVCSR